MGANVGPRIAFLGHSLGAVKCVYALAHEPALSAAALGLAKVILLSPPRLSYEWFCSSAKREAFLATHHQAEALVQQGRPDALLEATVPLPMAISAAGFLDKYGPQERYDFRTLLPSIRVPALFLFGSVEVENNVAFQESPALVEARRGRQPNLSLALIPGGDHFYTGVRDAAWAAIDRWLATE
jgi:pimeloyl-ACP methyl ester carboxylesterase